MISKPRPLRELSGVCIMEASILVQMASDITRTIKIPHDDPTGIIYYEGPEDTAKQIRKDWVNLHINPVDTQIGNLECALYAMEASLKDIFEEHGKRAPIKAQIERILRSNECKYRIAQNVLPMLFEAIGEDGQDLKKKFEGDGLANFDQQYWKITLECLEGLEHLKTTWDSNMANKNITVETMIVVLGIGNEHYGERLAPGVATRLQNRGDRYSVVIYSPRDVEVRESVAWVRNNNAEQRYGAIYLFKGYVRRSTTAT